VELVINTEGVPLTSGSKFEVASGKKDYNFKDITLDELEKAHILKVLKNNNDNISKTAKTLGIGRNTLYRKLEKHEINAP
jgi:transcriptional regulator of acetoin/glycerol metabolism